MARFSCIICTVLAVFNVAPSEVLQEAPVKKVVQMLTDLRSEVSEEGKAEAQTYDKFACFCKTATAEKTAAISDGENQKNVLQARMNEEISARDQADAYMANHMKAVTTLEGEIEEAYKVRNQERLLYEKSEVDLTSAIQGLEAAIMALKSAKTAVGFVQLTPIRKTLRTALLMAETLGLDEKVSSKKHRAVLVQLMRAEPVPQSIYEFHADDVISTLENLKGEFTSKKTELMSAESSAKATFDTLLQDKQKALDNKQAEIKAHKDQFAKRTKAFYITNQDFTTTSAQLLDDQAYLSEVSAKCNEKAVLWDQRTQMRANELNALTQAIEVINSLPSQEESSFLQHKPEWLAKAESAIKSASTEAALEDKDDALNKVSFLELFHHKHAVQHRHHRHGHQKLAGVGRRSKAVALLRAKAQKLHKVWLLHVAERVAEDPFAKVKTLIQELIERLLKEAEQEANHKGWCDREIALAEQSRDQSADDIKALNEQLEMSEPRRAKLSQRIKELDAELVTLNSDLVNQTTARQQEKQENEAAVASAKDGSKITQQAIDILTQFYGTAANAKSFLQKKRIMIFRNYSTVDEDAPEVGFDEVYTGTQGGKEGVIGMLEVVKSDFERTVSETDKAEAKAAKDFLEFTTTTSSSIATKKVAKQERETALSQADAEDKEARDSMKSKQTTMDQALTELNSLDKACRAGGTTAEEKKAKREEEMDALKQALCILEAHGAAATDTC